MQTRLGVSGTDLRPAFPLLFPPSHLPRAYLIMGAARPFRSLVRSLARPSVRPFESLAVSLFSGYPRGRFTRQLDLGKPSKTESRCGPEEKKRRSKSEEKREKAISGHANACDSPGNTHVTGAHAKIKLATRHRICDISSPAQ